MFWTSKNTRYSYEIGLLAKSFKDEKWRKTLTNKFPGAYIKVKSSFKNPTIQGRIIIVNFERTPWAWAKFDENLNYIKLYLKLDVE